MCMILVGRHVSTPCTRGLDDVADIQRGAYGKKRGKQEEMVVVRSKPIFTVCGGIRQF